MPDPVVSILTATYNRREFLPSLIEMVKAQTFNLKQCEWVILDDSPTSNRDLFEPLARLNTISVQYYHYDSGKLPIGQKRNMLNDLARGEYMVVFDDDDFHCPERISHSVTMLNSCKAEFAGNSEMYLYFSDDETVWKYQGHGGGHFTNGTAAYRRSYLRRHRYDDKAVSAEEASFSDRYAAPIVQLNPFRTILVKCHPTNTVDKRFTRMFNQSMKPTELKLRHFIKCPRMRATFKELGRFNGEPIRVPPSGQAVIQQLLSQQAAPVSACSGE